MAYGPAEHGINLFVALEPLRGFSVERSSTFDLTNYQLKLWILVNVNRCQRLLVAMIKLSSILNRV